MKLSIITVCLNSRRFLPQAIESVLSQDYQNFEYIIVDGGSSDGTVDLIKQYAENDPRILWSSEPDLGISDAMNKGAFRASGDVIAHLNSDDYYAHTTVFSQVIDCFKTSSSIVWLTGGLIFVAEDGAPMRELGARNYSFRRLLRGNILLHPATFIRREAFCAVGAFDPNLQYCMDYDLFLRLGEKAAPFVLDEQLTCFRIHADSRSVTSSEQAYAEELQVRMNYLHETGRPSWFYKIDYQIKSRLNRMFYKGLLSSSRKKS